LVKTLLAGAPEINVVHEVLREKDSPTAEFVELNSKVLVPENVVGFP
jgi:hypothetical protein